MSYIDDTCDGLLDKGLRIALYGSDYDIDCRDEEEVWECKDGTTVRISDMDTRHIKNCIAMIERSINNGRPWRTSYLKSLQEELDNRMFFEAMRRMSDEEFNKIVHKGRK